MNPPKTTSAARTSAAIDADRRAFLALPPATDSPFLADQAQELARDAVRDRDTILIAPTGYGKSWVAYEAAREVVRAGGRVYYTTPLKALSNQKFDDLGERLGSELVGVVTGDRREQPAAPVIVLTTEILRAMLIAGDRLAAPGAPILIVLDECHWLADPERGTTWEEVILLAPRDSRLLLLSASIGNGAQITAWLEQVRGPPPALIGVAERAVEQRWGAWSDDKIVSLGQAIDSGRASGGSPRWRKLVEALISDGLTPALIFLPTRRGCDAVVDQCRGLVGVTMKSHHAGLTLEERLAVERELQYGKLDVVCCTTTLASGIDAPVKTVVLGSLVDGRGEPFIWTTLQQMAGRAGRRGRDAVGFVIVLAPTVEDARRIERQRGEPPSAVESAFRPGYQTLLRLIAERGLARTRDLARRSFAAFQNARPIADQRAVVATGERRRDELLDELRPRACADPLTTWSQFMAWEKSAVIAGGPGDEARRLRAGYLCAHGIAFAKDTKRTPRALILSPGGTIEEWPQLPPAQPVSEDVDREVHWILRSLLDGPAEPPAIGQWISLGTVDAAWSVEQVQGLTADRVSFGGEGSYLRSRLVGKRVHTLIPEAFASRVQTLLERSGTDLRADGSSGAAGAAAFPCALCPSRPGCPSTVGQLAYVTRDLAETSRALAGLDPSHRVELISGVLRALGALDANDWPTDLGEALLATSDPAGLFFALGRSRLAQLSPLQLALVAAATRDLRIGRKVTQSRQLPPWYLEEVQRAAAVEAAAAGFGTLASLAADAEEWSPRRAEVLQILWNGGDPAGAWAAPGDVERLLRETLSVLKDLRAIPELAEAASAAWTHLQAAGRRPSRVGDTD